jgi:hypothetical protein
MTFDEMMRDYYGEDPTALPGPPMPQPMPVAGGGAESNYLRHLWDYQPPAELLKTQYMQPNFAGDWQMASHPEPVGNPACSISFT